MAGTDKLDDAQVAVAEDPTDATAQLQLGREARRRQNLAVAATALSHAVELSPDGSTKKDAKQELADVLVMMGYISEAETLLRDLISQEPQASSPQKPSTTSLKLANLLVDGRGERSAALEIYQATCDFGPTPIACLAGVTADSMGLHARAKGFYESSWAFDPDEDAALHLLISHARTGGDDASASKLRALLPAFVLTSLDYVLSTPVALAPAMHYWTYDMLRLAAETCTESSGGEEGLILEFGVYHGKSIRMLAAHFPEAPMHGFDTFSGIPEDWHGTRRGAYSTYEALPQVPQNVELHAGLFSDTLPAFLEAHPGPIRLMNIDADLYSSAKDVFDAAADRVKPGTVIIFDEYVMNPNWERDEYRAFQEAVAQHGWEYRYVGISLVSQQAVVQIL